jgi:hypothetical protein
VVVECCIQLTHSFGRYWIVTRFVADGKAIGKFAADCRPGAKEALFGRILTTSPDPRGPRVASRWSDDGAARIKKKTEWTRTVVTIQKSIEAMTAAELQRFGYDPISGRGIAVAEWEAYKGMGESDTSTIRWPPAVFARVAQLANTSVTHQPDLVQLTLIRPPTALPPNIRTSTTPGEVVE